MALRYKWLTITASIAVSAVVDRGQHSYVNNRRIQTMLVIEVCYSIAQESSSNPSNSNS